MISCPVTSVTAIGNDGNIPSDVIDNNLNTRWSNLGSGSWIQLDLGSMKSICSVDVNWYRGDIRQNNFVISVSNDGITFTNKFSGTSNLGTTAEKYSLPAGTEGRYVRITVNGNTENEWASINEIQHLDHLMVTILLEVYSTNGRLLLVIVHGLNGHLLAMV